MMQNISKMKEIRKKSNDNKRWYDFLKVNKENAKSEIKMGKKIS